MSREQLKTDTLEVYEGGVNAYIDVVSYLPPRLYCPSEDRSLECRVSITPTLLRKDKEVRCPGNRQTISQVVLYTDVGVSVVQPCSYWLTMDNWRSQLRIPLAGTMDGLKDNDRQTSVQVKATIIASGLAFESVVLGQVQVNVKDSDSSAICSAKGDPHITTTDGK